MFVARRDLLGAAVGFLGAGGQLVGAVGELAQAAGEALRTRAELTRTAAQGRELGFAGRGGFELAQAVGELHRAVGQPSHTARQGARAVGEFAAAVGGAVGPVGEVAGPVTQFDRAFLQVGGPVAQFAGRRADVGKALLHVGKRVLHDFPAAFAERLVQFARQGIGKARRHAGGEIAAAFGHVELEQAVLGAVAAQRPAAEVARNRQIEINIAPAHGFLGLGLAGVAHVVEFGVVEQLFDRLLAEVIVLAALGGAPVEVDDAYRELVEVAVGVDGAAQINGRVQRGHDGDGCRCQPHHRVPPQAALWGGQGLKITDERHSVSSGRRAPGPEQNGEAGR